MSTILAVDLGKSRCRVALWQGEDRTAAEGLGAPGLAADGGAFLAEAAILAVAEPLLRAAGLDRVERAGVGAAGALANPGAARGLAERLCGSLLAAEVVVASDAVTSHAGALGGAAGVVLAAGTGAVAVAVGPDGALHRIDGLGTWLGDEGSGSAIGQAGLRAALRMAEGRGPATILCEAAVARFGPLSGLADRIAGQEDAARLLAQFAPDVAQAARAGDPVARALMQEAGSALAATVRAAFRTLPDGRWPFAMVGGLLGAGAVLTDPLYAALRDGGMTPPDPVAAGTALDGARLLALRAAPLHEAMATRVAAAAAPGDQRDLLATEAVRPGLDDLDQRTPGDVARLVLEAERGAGDALRRAAPALAAAAEAVAARMRAGGRLFTLGAGTPGRLAVLDAAELGPTFNAPPGLVIPILAGGPAALLHASEGAEDDAAAAAAILDGHGLAAGDCVVGIAASGRTPFVLGGLRHARTRGALTVGIVNNARSPIAAVSDIAVEILTGPELIAGSTRMTAGTTQKVALNVLSTASMVAMGKTFGSRMVDMRATNEKLRRRARRTVREVAGVTDAQAEVALAASSFQVKTALVMLLAGLDAEAAVRRLERCGGRMRDAIHPDPTP